MKQKRTSLLLGLLAYVSSSSANEMIENDAQVSLENPDFWQIGLILLALFFFILFVLYHRRKLLLQTRYRSLVAKMPMVFIRYKKIVDKEGNQLNDLLFLDVNNAFEQTFCCKGDKIRNKKLSQVAKLYPELRAISPISLELSSPFVVHRRNSDNVYLGQIFIEEQPNHVIHLFCTDVTAQRIACQETESYKKLLEDITNITPVCVVVRDITDDMRFLFWNKKAEEVYGVTCEEMKTFPDEVIQRNALIAESDRIDHELIKTDASYHTFRKITKENGVKLTLACTKNIVRHPNGHKLLISSSWDVTDIKNEQETADELNMKLALVIKAAGMSRWTWNIKADLIHVNNEYARRSENATPLIQHLTKREFCGTIYPEDLQTFINAYELVRKGVKTGFDLEIRLRKDHDQHRYSWIHTFCCVQKYDEEGLPAIITGATVDISKQKELERKLRDAKELAELNDKQKSMFLSNLSQEMRTPLNTIIGFSNLMATTDKVEEKTEYAQIIKANNTLLLQLFDDILILSKIEANTFDFTYKLVDANQLFEKLEASLTKNAQNSFVDISFTERLHGGVKICIDEMRLMQVMDHFISNAMKNTHEGSIEFGYRRNRDGRLYFFVTDTGEGIPEEKQKLIFNRFLKLDPSKPGFGLGLSICESLVTKMEGQIGVMSKIGKGSTFWFIIPEHNEPAYLAADPITPQTSTNELVGEQEKPLILIAEDNSGNFRLFEILLKSRYRILHAWNGEEAVALYKENKPRLILMDIRMPKLDGYGATMQIRNISQTVPIIAVTAFAFEQDEFRISKSGFSAYLTKPIKTQLLHEKIERLLQKNEEG
ncbi:MAG: ATP-binding protein [Bacteroidaceae bacterium]